MSDELFAEVKSEGNALDIDKAFERLETKGEESPESQPEKNTASPSQKGEESTPAEEKTPFHKHPRWIKTQETLNEYKGRIADFEKKFADLEKGSKQVELPEWWKQQYGDTQESKDSYLKITQKDGELDWIKGQILSEIKNETKQEQTQVTEGEQYVDTQLAEMTDEGLKFDRNSLLKFMVDFQEEFGAGSLLDQDGNYDFRKALSMKERMEPEATDNTDTKKQLASNAGRSKVQAGSSSKIPVISRRSLRKGGWREAGI